MSNIGYLTESTKCLTKEEAVSEASRCTGCEGIVCNAACPIEVDAKQLLYLVKEEKFKEACELLREQNPIAAISSRVCPYESYCVGACREKASEKPVIMSHIERFLTEYEMSNNLLTKKEVEINEDSKIAIIGSGPSGLSAAATLARNGHKVTVFDDRREVGGWLRYGIPPHRLPKEVIQYEVDYIQSLGVEFVTNTTVGRDITIDKLREEGYKAILIATGFNKGRILKVKGYELNGVVDGVAFLANAKGNDGNIPVGKSAIVIGGGDVAMDCATTAKLTGYEKVRVVVRGSMESMTASQKELNYLHKVRVPVFDYFDSKEIIGDENGNVCAMEFVGLNDSSTLRLEADTVIFAVGQMPVGITDIADVELCDKGCVATKDFQSSIEDIFATGDIINGEKTACYATALGKQSAEAIHKYLVKKEVTVTV